MNTWKVILATLVIFIAGVLTGGLLVGYSDRAQHKRHDDESQFSFLHTLPTGFEDVQ